MTTVIKPLGNRVLVKRAKAQTSKGGILLPDSAQEKKPNEGEVIAVGPGSAEQPMSVKINDRVLFSSYSGTNAQLPEDEDNEYLIISEDEILGVIS